MALSFGGVLFPDHTASRSSVIHIARIRSQYDGRRPMRECAALCRCTPKRQLSLNPCIDDALLLLSFSLSPAGQALHCRVKPSVSYDARLLSPTPPAAHPAEGREDRRSVVVAAAAAAAAMASPDRWTTVIAR